jgi:hypothetical protein
MAIDRSQFITASATGTSSLNAVFSSAITVGNLIVVHASKWANNVANSNIASILDNQHTATYTNGCLSTMTSDTQAQCALFYKLSVSSGGAASTYRVSLNSSGGVGDKAFCAVEYSGGPFTVGSTGSSNGTSTSPRGPSLTASSTPALFVMSATENSSAVFRDTVTAGTWVTTLNPNNATGQILFVSESTGSSLTQQLTAGFSNVSTRWVAVSMVFKGLGSGGGGAAATGAPWTFCMTGCQ